MAHTSHNKGKLLNRVRRIKGQVEALERALINEHDCSLILNTLVACRGALNGLLSEVLVGHIRSHIANPDLERLERDQAAEEIIDLLKMYLK